MYMYMYIVYVLLYKKSHNRGKPGTSFGKVLIFRERNFCHFCVLSKTQDDICITGNQACWSEPDSEVGENSYLACENVSCVLTSKNAVDVRLQKIRSRKFPLGRCDSQKQIGKRTQSCG